MISTLATIAYRDFIKLIRDKTRLVTSLIFPMLFIGILGSSLQANLSEDIGYNFITFIFTGVLGQTLFQSTASGIVSLVEDRVNDFSQEMFVAPINRYTIIFGKILGETSVSLVLASSILIIGFVIGVPITAITLISILPVALICCLLGGAFGVLVVANLGSERAANQIFPFIIFPQYFLSGVFNPIKELPFFLDILSKLTPMR